MSLRRPRNRTRPRTPASATAASTAGRSGPSPTIQATASGRVRQDPRQRAHEHVRRLGRAQPLDQAHDRAPVGDALGGADRPARGLIERRHRPEVDARADEERLTPRHRVRRQDAEREALREILPGHEHGGVAEAAREPLEADEDRPPPVDGVIEGPAVDRLDGDRDSRQSRGQGCEKARLGRARVDHVRPEPAEEGHQARRGRGGPARARARGPGSPGGDAAPGRRRSPRW